jgi:acyl carrier protein
MTNDELRALLITELGEIAPDQDAAAIAADADIREALDIDSMDFLNFITALHRKLGIDVPERDYPQLFTLGKAVAYLKERLK